MFVRYVLVIATLLFTSAMAPHLAAQETTGTIEGVVKDSGGAILPGVTVEADGAVRRSQHRNQ